MVKNVMRNLLLATTFVCWGIVSLPNPSLSKTKKPKPAPVIRTTPISRPSPSVVVPTVPEEEKYSIQGSFQLIARNLHRGSIFSGEYSKCLGIYLTGERNPILMDSIPLKFLDASGKIVGISKFENGKISAPTACEFEFSFKNVSKSDFYTLEVGTDGKLGKKNFSFEQLKKDQWKIRIGLDWSNITR